MNDENAAGVGSAPHDPAFGVRGELDQREHYLAAKARVAHDAIAVIMAATGQTFMEVANDISDMAELDMLPKVAGLSAGELAWMAAR